MAIPWIRGPCAVIPIYHNAPESDTKKPAGNPISAWPLPPCPPRARLAGVEPLTTILRRPRFLRVGGALLVWPPAKKPARFTHH